MFIIKPHIFDSFPEIVAGVSSKSGLNRNPPYYFNMSFNVNDDKDIVKENRQAFFNKLGIRQNEIAFQNQIHSDIISSVKTAGNCGNSDAMITQLPSLALSVTVADCTPVLIYDSQNRIIAAIHSGWKGAKNNIVFKTLVKMKEEFNSEAANLYAYLGPSISQSNYEIGKDVSDQFDKKYIATSGNRLLLDVPAVNYDQLIKFGIERNHIQKSDLCTFQLNDLLHSYRRDGINSGRSLAVIMMRNN